MKQDYYKMTKEERAREGVSECLDNLLIDEVVMEDAKDRRRNMACAWIDVRKAYTIVLITLSLERSPLCTSFQANLSRP